MLTVSYLVNYDTLLQKATGIITKCDNYFITKCDKGLLQNALILIQNAKFVTKWSIIMCI